MQDVVMGGKRGFKTQRIMQATGGAKAVFPHALVDCPNFELPVKPSPCLRKIPLLQFIRNS